MDASPQPPTGPLAELLALDGRSRRAEIVRVWLAGSLPLLEALGAGSGAAGQEGDPGADAFAAWLGELRGLLARGGAAEPAAADAGASPAEQQVPPRPGYPPAAAPVPRPPVPVPAVAPSPTAESVPAAAPSAGLRDDAGPGAPLRAFADQFLADPAVRTALGPGTGLATGDTSASGDPPGPLWTELHLAMLRLPARAARRWRQDAAAVPGARPETDSGPWREVPALSAEEELIPAHADWHVTGLRTRQDAELPQDIAEAAALRTGDRGAAWKYAVLCAQVLTLAELDPELQDLVAGPVAGQPEPLTSGRARAGYRRELLARLRDFAERLDAPPEQRVIAARSLDEALCSTVHLPPSARLSWWETLTRHCRNITFELLPASGPGAPGARLRLLSGPYAQAAAHTTGDIACRGAATGQVLRCLRLSLTGADHHEPEGRVVHGV